MYGDDGHRVGLFDADAHVVEQPDLWVRDAPQSMTDRVPRSVTEDGNEWLVCGGRKLMSAAHMSGLVRRDRHLPRDGTLPPARWDTDVLKGAFDPVARLADMDVDGVDAAIVYPTAALTFYSIDDRELVAQLLATYNGWLSEFCRAGTGRLHGVGALLTDEPGSAVAEARRCCALGHVGLLIPLYEDRDVDFGDPGWDPLWAAAEEMGMPIGFHALMRGPGSDSPITPSVMDALVGRPARVQRAVLSAILGGVFTRFPGLRLVSAENEAGWAGSMLELADQSFARGRFEGGPERRRPSEVFSEHVWLTVLFDRSALHARRVIGTGNLMWSSDYPHNMSFWPHSAQHIAGWVDQVGVSDTELAQILGGNVQYLYRLPSYPASPVGAPPVDRPGPS